MNQILQGDALTVLRSLPDGIVQTVVTSPPYYGLRDYGVDDQIGLEATPEAYIARLVEVFREVRRVLRSDGTAWVNIGDSYAAGGGADYQRLDELGERMGTGGGKKHSSRKSGRAPISAGLKPKDLIGIPWMLAFALRADGWYLRSDIIWHKPNCMPESVEDRPTKSHEYLFLLSKSERYFYDANAIREPGTEWAGQAGTFARAQGKSTYLSIPGQSQVSHRDNRDDRVPSGRNKRSVWTISTQSYSEAHFATFPPKLIEPCILAGTSSRACEHCRAPWERVITKGIQPPEPTHRHPEKRLAIGQAGNVGAGNMGFRASRLSGQEMSIWKASHPDITTGWQPTCTCEGNTGEGHCIVLDCFMGAGTVALVALQYNRAYLGIELNPAYIALAEKRIAEVQPVLWEVPA